MSFLDKRELMFTWIGASLFIGALLLIVFFFGCCLFVGVYTRCGRLSTKMMEENEIYLKWKKEEDDKLFWGKRV